MHLLERFSSACGSKYAPPAIEEAYFPLPFEKYITINRASSHANQIYDYWPDVVQEIFPLLKEAKIHLVDIGDTMEGMVSLPHAYNLRGKLNLKQLNYVIKNSEFHACGDSFCADLANLAKTKTCQVFGSTPAYYLSPLWHKQITQIVSPPKAVPPSFGAPTDIKVINSITPETVSCLILNELGLSQNLSFCTKFIGSKYHLPTCDIVPDFLPTPSTLPGNVLHLRLDYTFDEALISPWARDNRKLILVTNRQLNPNLIFQHKTSIPQIQYEVDASTCPDYLQTISQLGIPLYLYSRCPDQDDLKELRLKLIDWVIDHKPRLGKKNLDNYSKIDYNTALYQSSRHIMSHGEQFPSKQAWLGNLPLNRPSTEFLTASSPPVPIVDTPGFWAEQEHFRIIQPKI